MRLDELNKPKPEELSEEELIFVLDFVEGLGKEITSKEFHQAVKTEAEDFTRGGKSLYHAALRMYLIVHNRLPQGTTPNKAWNIVSQAMVDVAAGYGHDINDNLSIVRAKERKEKEKRMTKEKAKELMLAYYNDHKHNLDSNAVSKARPQIQTAIRNGEHVDVVFDPFFITEQVLKQYYKRILECTKKRLSLKEGLTAQSFGEIGDLLNDALVKYNAAKRGLGITNKLRDPADRAQHRSRIMGNLNRLRASVRKIEQQF